MAAIDNSRREFLKLASAAMAGASTASLASAGDTATASTILNYQPSMKYRRLGKTDFMISEIALGGHPAAGGPDLVQNRVEVLERAVALGMNYVDNNIDKECDLYGEAMARSSGANRDKWFIGFASWPEKITEEYEAELTPEKMMGSIEARLKSYKTDMLDMWRPVGATWGEGQTRIATLLMVSHKALDMVVEVFEKAKQQGKVRFLGVSAHNPKVFRRVLNEYPQFSVIIFPYLFLTKEFGGDSLLALAAEKNVGVIGLKPFGAGMVFGLKPQQIDKAAKVDAKAHVLIKQMLQEKRLSAIIPGVGTPDHLEENIKGSYQRDLPQTPEEEQTLREYTERYYASLVPHYQWLRNWEVV
jgi:aryl-alcohol dehydrogenase-like predicted oxidoreductase